MPEHRHRAVRSKCQTDDLIGTISNRLDGFPIDHWMTPYRPVGDLPADIDGSPPLVDPVIPFHEIVGSHGGVCQPGSFHRFPRSNQRAGKYESELRIVQHASQCVGLTPAEICQRNVGPTGVLSAGTPLGLAVANEHHVVRAVKRTHEVAQFQSEPSSVSASIGPQLPRGYGRTGRRSSNTPSTTLHASMTPSCRANRPGSPRSASPIRRS